jgi:ferredoxin, 2Fe-2S
MPKIRVRTRNGDTRTIEAQANQSLMEALRDNGIDEIEALCGGSCACATCHVFVSDPFLDKLAPMGEAENGLLDASDSRRASSRLSCQITLTDDLDGIEIEVAPAM